MRRLRLGTIVLLAAALAATGCTGGGDTSSSPPASGAGAGSSTAAAGADRLNLRDVCPNPIVVQTDWFPETEYGVLYHLLGPNPKVDTKNDIVNAPLVAEGKDTGVRLEVRSGEYAVTPVGGTGSHLIAGYAAADSLIVVPEEITEVPVGTPVPVMLLERRQS